MKHVLVTGASGFVGTHLVKALLEEGESEVYAAVFGRGSNLSGLLDENHIMTGDLTNSAYAESLIQKVQPEIVYHLAALAVVHDSIEKAGQVLTANMLLQYNILESVRRHAPGSRFIAVCSAHEYGLVSESDIPIDEDTPFKPLNPYAVSKVFQDMLAYQYCQAYGMDIVRLRPFNHTGEGQTVDFVIPAMAKQFVDIKKGLKPPEIEIGNTDSIRDFTDVKDIVRAYILSAKYCKKGEVYNIGFGKGITIGEIIHLFEDISGVKVTVKTNESKVRQADIPVLICDASKFKEATGWETKYTLRETLTRVYNYLEELN